MSAEAALTLPHRLANLWDHLGVGAAHVAAQMPGDLAGIVTAAPERVAGVVLCVPSRLDPAPFAGVARRLLMIAGEGDLTDAVTARALPRLPGAARHVLHGYAAPGWADVVTDRAGAIAGWMTGHLRRFPGDPPRAAAGAEGVVAGISYRIQGAGPALVLLPFFLAPSQWDAAIPMLARQFTVVTLGGRHVGGVAALEDRARAPSYRAMVRGLIEHMAPQPGETILDIGSGSGALDRMLAALRPANPITAIDVNPFLRREAMALAAEEGCGHAIAFLPGSAEALPFPDASFDCVFTVTVLEECDADQALREAWRVLRPGGRAGVIVRAIDLPQWWNLDLPPPLRARAETPPQSIGARGVADASLYRRMRAAGFAELVAFPSLVTLDHPDGPIWRYREDHLLSLLSADETVAWNALTSAARRDGVLLMAHPMHCATGVKPHATAA
ncbi:MAG TPA: methyltransferase domain-containing protein [Acetobacteraceae bacterium]|nr:methyltransferase domain-containing protein [Acetobacteraceae bacterium]